MHKSGLTELDVVLAVSRRRAFRAAAIELDMSTSAVSNAVAGLDGRRQLLLPLATIILSGLEPSSLVHHRAVWRQGRQKLRFRDLLIIAPLIERMRSSRSGVLLLPATGAFPV